MHSVDAVQCPLQKKTKNICPFSIVIRRQIPNCKTGRRWIRRIGQRLKGCGSFRVSSGRVWLTPTRENQWLDADKNPPRGFSFRYTSGAAPAPKLPIFLWNSALIRRKSTTVEMKTVSRALFLPHVQSTYPNKGTGGLFENSWNLHRQDAWMWFYGILPE